VKRVLIVGAHSYVARSFLDLYHNNFDCGSISVRDEAWRGLDLSCYDAVLWCAAIVHQKQRKEDGERYFAVNRDLPVAFARKAAQAGVRQFVFLSTMAVYGLDEGAVEPGREPAPRADDFYARSKWEAEQGLRAMEDKSFRVTVLRPPMVTGAGAPGNYARLVKLARSLPLFPDYPNARSVCPVDVLCAEIARVLEAAEETPAGSEARVYPVVSTADLAREIALKQNRPIRFTKAFNPLIRCLIPRSRALRKAFGTLYYRTFPGD